MKEATIEILKQTDELFEKRRIEILNTKDELAITGTTYYVCNDGDDNNDGKSPDTAWKTLKKATIAPLKAGDGVLFRRGDLFRGRIKVTAGVSYGAYVTGDKPKFYGSEMSLADPALWEEYDKEHHIWKCTEKTLDSGTLVFNDGEAHSRKLIPSYKNLQFVCRDDESRPFVMAEEMTQNLDIFWHYDEMLTRTPSRGENFPIPYLSMDSYGDLYLRCDEGNPGEVFNEIENVARTHMFRVGERDNVTIDNICIKYVGMHGVSGGIQVAGLRVTNCEMGWIGGAIQHYDGTDPNYPQGGRGTVTRFGNAIENGGCEGYTVANNYIYEIYDAGITHQVTTKTKRIMKDILYADNVVEKCVYGIEYFLDQIEGESESFMDNYVIRNNHIRLSGYGWGQQRHNTNTPAAIKSWNFTNTARNYKIHDNIFDRSAYRLLHLVAEKQEYCPEMKDNTYIQSIGGMLGQYGGKENGEPQIRMFDDDAKTTINNVFGDKSAKVYYTK